MQQDIEENCGQACYKHAAITIFSRLNPSESDQGWWHGVSYSQKFYSKHNFPNLTNSKTSPFMLPKYLVKYQNVKVCWCYFP